MGKLYNLARMSTSTTGTGTITLGSAVSGFLSFASAGVQDGNTVTYAIKDGTNSEIGRGVYTSSGTTLTRSVLKSTNSDSAINLSGSAEVFITAAAEDFSGLHHAQGRLTLSSGVPVMTSTVTGAGTIYYMPYVGSYVPLFDGTSWKMVDIVSQRSNVLADSSTGKAGPAAATTNSNYDLFVWDDAGTIRLTRGPAWTSDTGRGTGTGTTELNHSGNYILTNKQDITNGPVAGRGTYVGTIRTNGSSTVDFNFGGSAAGGGGISFGVWNTYNRLEFAGLSFDTTDSWTYNATTWRGLNNNSAGNFARAIAGLAEDFHRCTVAQWLAGNTTSTGTIAIGIGSTTPASPRVACLYTGSALSMFGTTATGGSWQGWGYFLPLEAVNNANSVNFYGDAGQTVPQSGVVATFVL